MLKCGILRIRRWSGAIASVYANHYFDRIGHRFMSLSCQAMGVDNGPRVSMLSYISLVNVFLRTGYSDSRTYLRGNADALFEGLGLGTRQWCRTRGLARR